MAQQFAEQAAAGVVADQAQQQGIPVDAQQVLQAKAAADAAKTPVSEGAARAKSAKSSPTEGLKTAYADFLVWLRAPHGQTVDSALLRLETTTGLQREQLSYVLGGLLTMYMVLGNGAQLVSNFIGFAYPAYASVKALRTEGKDDDTQWLIYWTTFASFFLVDSIGVMVLQFFPVYWVLKTLFLVFLYLPQTQGALYLYENAVDPAVTFIDERLLKKYL